MYDLTTPNQSSGPMSFEQIHDRLSVDMNDEAAAADLRSRILRWVIDDRIMDHLVVGGEDVINETLYLVLTKFRNSWGRETFSGFVRGHYMNARKEAWRNPRRFRLTFRFMTGSTMVCRSQNSIWVTVLRPFESRTQTSSGRS